MKFKSWFKSGAAGVDEITGGDLTEGEERVVRLGVGTALLGTVVHVIGEPVVGAVVTGSHAAWVMAMSKGIVIGGCVFAVGGLGKAFARGFMEQMRSELATGGNTQEIR